MTAPPGSVSLGFSVDFGGTSYNHVYVNNNGNVTFTNSESTATPHSMASNTLPIIAPFFADVDTRLGNVVSYRNDTVNGNSAFGVDWVKVGYYNQHTSSLNSFQLILINRPDLGSGAFEVEFNYDHIGWETGDGSGGLGGTSAYAGRVKRAASQSCSARDLRHDFSLLFLKKWANWTCAIPDYRASIRVWRVHNRTRSATATSSV